jgi:hypothetical protein
MISTSISKNSITVVITDSHNSQLNKLYTLSRSHPNFESVLEAVRNNDEDTIHSLLNIAKSIETFVEGKVRVENGHVYYENFILDGIIVNRILAFIKEKLPVIPLLKFINKLYENPSAKSIKELYSFLEHKNMPITPDGNFLAYKGVQRDFFSKTAGSITVLEGTVVNGKIYNGVGETIIVRRNQVCDDNTQGCSSGIHAGSINYATEFAGMGGKVVIVEINPADVVSVPLDCNCQKLRTCAYKVVAEFETPLDDNYCDSYYNSNDCFDDADSDDADSDDADSDDADSDDVDSDDVDFDDVDFDDIDELFTKDEFLDIAYSNGFDFGYNDGVSNHRFIGRREIYVPDEVVYFRNKNYFNRGDLGSEGDYVDVWEEGYKAGYDDGVIDRNKLTNKLLI